MTSATWLQAVRDIKSEDFIFSFIRYILCVCVDLAQLNTNIVLVSGRTVVVIETLAIIDMCTRKCTKQQS